MADPILIPIPDLSPIPDNWDMSWLLPLAKPDTKRAYKVTGDAFTQKLIESGAIADIRNTKFYVVGRGNPGDPSPGDSTIVDNTLQGFTFTGVKLRGTGDLIPGDEYTFDNIDTITFYSLDPDNPGPYLFNEGDVIIVTFEPKISSYVSAPGSIGRMYAGVKSYSASGNILPTDYQKLQQIVAISQPVTLVLPPGADYPPGIVLTITTNMVNTYQSTIQTAGTDVIFITASGKSKLVLGVDAQLRLVWNDDGAGTKGWYVDHISDDYKMVGQFVFSYYPLPNTIAFDGSLISRALYPRAEDLLERIIAKYGINAVVSNAVWESDPFTHRTKWAYGPTEDVLRCPDWRGLFVRALPGDRANIDIDRGSNAAIPGSYENWAVGPHVHPYIDTGKLGAGHANFLGGGTYDAGEQNRQTAQNAGNESRGVNGGLNAFGYI